jgi:hypothetical protein
LWKRTELSEDMYEHLSMDAYEVQIQEMIISQLRAHHIGCVMVYLSARELHDCIQRSDEDAAWQRMEPGSRLSYHLKVCDVLKALSCDRKRFKQSVVDTHSARF